MINTPSSLLYASPSAIEGVARLIDLGATLQVYNTSPTSDEADVLALAHDWLVVGDDIRNAVSQYESEQE